MKKIALAMILALAVGQTKKALADISVPASEVPNICTWLNDPSCTTSLSYTRHDDAPTITNGGTPATVAGSSLDCNNCGSENTMDCRTTLSATFSESFTASIDSGIQVGIDILKASLKSSLGVSASLSVTYSTTCGSASVSPHTHTVYTVYQNVTNGKAAKIVSTYTCLSTTTGGPNPPCPVGSTASQPGGTRTSTSTGNVGSSSGGCTSQDVACP